MSFCRQNLKSLLKNTAECLLYTPQVKTNTAYTYNDAVSYSQGERVEKKSFKKKYSEQVVRLLLMSIKSSLDFSICITCLSFRPKKYIVIYLANLMKIQHIRKKRGNVQSFVLLSNTIITLFYLTYEYNRKIKLSTDHSD